MRTGQSRIRFYLEWIPLPFQALSAPHKTFLGEFKDYVEGDNLYLTLATRAEGPNGSWQFFGEARPSTPTLRPAASTAFELQPWPTTANSNTTTSCSFQASLTIGRTPA
jgi:hypothetical protein